MKLGYCNKHYIRQYRGKDITQPTIRDPRPAIIEGEIAKIPLGIGAKDGYAIVDSDMAWISMYQWHKLVIGYAHCTKQGYMHHIIMGKQGKGAYIDHINRDKLDNRRENLRIVSATQSASNTAPVVGSSSVYKGVWLRKKYGTWIAEISPNGKKIHLGSYKTPEQAARAYDKAAIEYFGEYAYLNFPNE